MFPESVSSIAKAYLDFFEKNGHTAVPSSSLVPSGDPTLLFTTAGMVQFKPLFTGAVALPYTRATSLQKCIRTTDLEVVGKTERHCTFFEMLGNFSFGDYFKKEAIQFALEFSIQGLGIPKDKIWVTVFLDDDEAVAIWKDLGIPEERITRLGKKDNFWGPAGDSGACGPCSELYLDRGRSKGEPDCGDKASCRPGCDCDRFLEYWNLVFNQFNQKVTGELEPLKQTGIDTGSGLERVAMLLQGVDSVYDTDELRSIISEIEKLSGKLYSNETKISFRVITDHSRSVFFAIGDRIQPDKTGRGYVVRRLIRRAGLFLKKLGVNEPFLYRLVPKITSIYSSRYPELLERSSEIQRILKSEEELFYHTLEVGLGLLEETIQKESERGIFSGRSAFVLYSTYGFPVEMTRELVLDSGLKFDEEGFQDALEKDRDLSRSSWRGKKQSYLTGLNSPYLKTKFSGYTKLQEETTIELVFAEGIHVDSLSSPKEGILVLRSTPFYAEGGGQLGDQGFIRRQGMVFQVFDTQKENDTYLHFGQLLHGEVLSGLEVSAEVLETRRQGLREHHSGTHLLNGALRKILGDHVYQKGSVVFPDSLRFDFSHPSSLTEEEIRGIERIVNQAIQESIPVITDILPIQEAKLSGALSMFDEKYGDEVRVVSMGNFSKEFCGGTHVNSTKELDQFLILKEASPGAGTRRIEAVCGKSVVDYFVSEFQALQKKLEEHNLRAKSMERQDLVIAFEALSPEKIWESFQKKDSFTVSNWKLLLKNLLEGMEVKGKELFKDWKKREAEIYRESLPNVSELLKDSERIGEMLLIAQVFPNTSTSVLKELGDQLKSQAPNAIGLFAFQEEERTTLLFVGGKTALAKGWHSGEVLKKVIHPLGGKGGGKPDLAQGGGRWDVSLEEVITRAKKIAKEHLGV